MIENILAAVAVAYTQKISPAGIGRSLRSFELGRLSAELFCKIIIREDSDLRGKATGETTVIVKRGIESSCFNPPVVNIPNEKQVLLFAMENAMPNTLVMLCVENIEEVISLLKMMQKHEKGKRRIKPVKKVIQMEKVLHAEMNMLQQ